MDINERIDCITAGNDLPVSKPQEDKYGFNLLAEKLAQSVFSLDTKVSTVIGIEGVWGAGKTSLLNLLRGRLEEDKPKNTHILSVSPWLSASGNSIESLLLPVAAILDEEQAKRYSPFRRFIRRKFRQRASTLATDILHYAQQSSGRLAPLAELAGYWIPGAGVAAKVMNKVAAVDLSARKKTAAELRTDIETRISRFKLNFIFILDDLDRLEPAQAVEVIRLVRSVADFSRFHYIMCYDPAVLGHAVEKGLNVENGRHYLQKIIQLSFSLPRPESFDLRREFMAGAINLFERTGGLAADYSLIQDLRSVTDTFGATLTTPREVRLVLGSLEFRYPQLKDSVWFPDLCLLQLLRITLPELYEWTEHYLTEYAAQASGSGAVTDKEKKSITEKLEKLLSSLPAGSPLSVLHLNRWLPGIEGHNKKHLKVFCSVSDRKRTENDSAKRLSSGFYWRFYFAFIPPKDVLPPEFFKELFRLAGKSDDLTELEEMLFKQMKNDEFSDKWWFDHIIDRLTPPLLEQASPLQCRGLFKFILRNGMEILRRYNVRGEWLTMSDLALKQLADNLLLRLREDTDREQTLNLLKNSLTEESTFVWTTSYLRHLLWQNGLAGNQPVYEQNKILTDKELRELCRITEEWLEDPEHKQMLFQQDDISDIVFAWQEISSPQKVADFIKSVTHDDGDFLQVLLWLRFKGISSEIGKYQGLRMSSVTVVLGAENVVFERLNRIEQEGRYPEQVRLIREALQHS